MCVVYEYHSFVMTYMTMRASINFFGLEKERRRKEHLRIVQKKIYDEKLIKIKHRKNVLELESEWLSGKRSVFLKGLR